MLKNMDHHGLTYKNMTVLKVVLYRPVLYYVTGIKFFSE